MDEPTNHLDMRSKRVLQDALDDYEGSFVIVSHDRDFLDPLVTKVVEFRDGQLRTFLGNVSEFLDARAKENAAVVQDALAWRATPAQSEKERKRFEAEVRQERYARTKLLRGKIEQIERSIEARERRKREIEEQMADVDFYKNGDQAKAINAEYREIEKQLNNEYHIWNEVTKQLESIEAEYEEKARR
jgi:ATP-binding cassette subfamily F protein 3